MDTQATPEVENKIPDATREAFEVYAEAHLGYEKKMLRKWLSGRYIIRLTDHDFRLFCAGASFAMKAPELPTTATASHSNQTEDLPLTEEQVEPSRLEIVRGRIDRVTAYRKVGECELALAVIQDALTLIVEELEEKK